MVIQEAFYYEPKARISVSVSVSPSLSFCVYSVNQPRDFYLAPTGYTDGVVSIDLLANVLWNGGVTLLKLCSSVVNVPTNRTTPTKLPWLVAPRPPKI